MQAARSADAVLGADRSIIGVILDKRADQVGRAFNGRNDRCTTAQPRGAASRSAGIRSGRG